MSREISNEVLKPFAAMFASPLFQEFWSVIDGWYKQFNFRDDISDAQRYEEYIYIHEQMKKFVATRETQMAKFKDKDSLADYIEQQIANLNDKPDSTVSTHVRAQLVYQAIRFNWLLQFYNALKPQSLTTARNGKEEE